MKLFRECKKSENGLHSRKRESFVHTEIHNGEKEEFWTHVIVCAKCDKILSKPHAGK